MSEKVDFEKIDRVYQGLLRMRELRYEQLRRLGRELNEAQKMTVVDKV